MSLKMILGPSGSGKSRMLFDLALRQAGEEPDRTYLVLVPEQFTMQTQQKLCSLSPTGGILNIDILSFSRLAVRVFEETGSPRKTLLRETGKSLLLRLIAEREASGLSLLHGAVDRPGALAELKSILSEMDQYGVTDADMQAAESRCKGRPALAAKLRQLRELREKYREYQEQHGLQTMETVPEALCRMIPLSEKLKGSRIYLDGYTGFTPPQLDILRGLMGKAESVTVTVTMDPEENLFGKVSEDELFAMSKNTVRSLTELARETGTEIEKPVLMCRDHGRFPEGSPLGFLERNLFRRGRRRPAPKGLWTGEGDYPVSIVSCAGPAEEAQAAAALIRDMTHAEPGGKRNFRYRDIAVVASDFSAYSEQVRRAFSRAKVPFFMDRPVPVALNPAFEFVRDAFAVIDSGYSYESMMALMRTGFVFDDRETADRLENYILAAGIRGKKAWSCPFMRPAEGYPEESLPELEQIRQGLMEKFMPFAEVCRHSSALLRDYARALWTLLDDFGLQEKLNALSQEQEEEGKRAEAQIFSQAAGVIASVLDEAAALLGDETVKRTQFEQILEAGFAEAKIGIIPPGTDEVHVGDLTRTRLTDVKVVLVLGMNDDYVPARQKGGGILTDVERTFLSKNDLKLAPTEKEDAQIQRFYLYLMLTKPSDRLILSYSRMGDDGKPMRPASLIGEIRSLLPETEEKEGIPGGILGAACLPEQMTDTLAAGIGKVRTLPKQEQKEKEAGIRQLAASALVFDPERARRLILSLAPRALPALSPEAAALLYGHVLEGSVSRLETFALCPYQQYAQYGLGLRERDRFEVRSSDVGSLMHRGIELFTRKVQESKEYSWRDLPDEVSRKMAEESLREAALEKAGGKFEDTFRNEGQFHRLLSIFLHSVAVLRMQIAAGSFVPRLLEVRFDSSRDRLAQPLVFRNGSFMHLSGRIDRIDESIDIDQNKVYMKVLDYKTGSTLFDLRQVAMGTELQLLVYMDYAAQLEKKRNRKSDVICAGILYTPLRDPVLKQDKTGEDPVRIDLERRKAIRPSGLILSDGDVIRRFSDDPSYLPYVAPASFNKDGTKLTASSSTADQEHFRILAKFARLKMLSMGEQILAGQIAPAPLRESRQDSACTFCGMKDACPFSDGDPLMKPRRKIKGKQDDIWQLIGEAVSRDGGL